MPELVEKGPVIPVELMNKLDDGKSVFFCGAGISTGTGLPNFKGLVDYIYEASLLEPDELEREALDLGEPVEERRHPKIDKVLGLLEREHRLGSNDPRRPSRVRQIVIERLSRRSKGPLKVHRALIDLSTTTDGVRLITTNFDNRFRGAGLPEKLIDASPLLPFPKPHDWHSLVHLHGRIMSGDGGQNLVLAAADFGRAYLTERWASRFITELFRQFTVIFVGYSLDDPVMSYMVDALAAERSRGGHFGKANAFAGHDSDAAGRQRVIDGWLAKNVEPIPYDQRDNHRYLNDTLIEWARIKNDPFATRVQIALNEISKFPNGPTDPIAMRVAWALEEPVAARALAESPPIADEADFVKVAAWLDVFDQADLLSRAARRPEAGDVTPVTLVDSGVRTQNSPDVDPTTLHLATFIARHLHVPQVLEWVAKKGGCLHPALRDQVRMHLAETDSNVHPKLRFLWTLLANSEASDMRESLWLSGQYTKAATDREQSTLAQQAIFSVLPQLKVRPGASSRLRSRNLFKKDETPISLIDGCVHLELVIGDPDFRHDVDELIARPEILAAHAEELTTYLELAIDLLASADEYEGLPYFYRPSITPHKQNAHKDDWTILIDWVRDSYLAVAKTDRTRAKNLLNRWIPSKKPLFKRLALHAITEDTKSNIRLAESLLLKGHKPGLWDLELHREVLRFLRKAGNRLPRELRSTLMRAIQAGPARSKKKPSEEAARITRRAIGLRYYKLRQAGVRLIKKASDLANEAAPDPEVAAENQEEFLWWSGEARWVAREEYAPQEFLDKPFADVAVMLRENRFGAENFEGLALQQPVRCVRALGLLAREGQWPSLYWQRFLWAIGGLRRQGKLHPGLQTYTAVLLSLGPEVLFSEVGSAAGDFVEEIAKIYSTDRENLVAKLWNKAWTGIGHEPHVGIDDALTQSLNHAAGKLAEAALHRLWKYEPKPNAGLPDPTRHYFDTVASDTNGHLGRVMLATRLYQLFAFDPDWTSTNLISRLTPVTSEEAKDLWSAYGWSPTVAPNLLAAFKEPFLDFLRHSEDLDRGENNLVGLFISICLQAPDKLTTDEIQSVVQNLPEAALVTAIYRLGDQLDAVKGKQEDVWHQQIAPWLAAYWPSTSDKKTAKTSEALLNFLTKTGTAYPKAVSWALDYLKPIEQRGLYALKKSNLHEKYPRETLELLKRLVSEAVLPSWEKGTLKEILDTIKQNAPQLGSIPDFQRLYRIATH